MTFLVNLGQHFWGRAIGTNSQNILHCGRSELNDIFGESGTIFLG